MFVIGFQIVQKITTGKLHYRLPFERYSLMQLFENCSCWCH